MRQSAPDIQWPSIKGIRSIIILGLSLCSVSCAPLERSVSALGDLFKGNTRRDPRDYNLEVRSAYKKNRYLQKVLQSEEEREILKRLQAEDKEKASENQPRNLKKQRKSVR